MTGVETAELALSRAKEAERAAVDIIAVNMNVSTQVAFNLVREIVKSAMYRTAAALADK